MLFPGFFMMDSMDTAAKQTCADIADVNLACINKTVVSGKNNMIPSLDAVVLDIGIA